MRLRVRRRKILHTIIKTFCGISILLTIYIYSETKSESIGIKKKPSFNIKVLIIENENDAISFWQNATEEIDFSSSLGTMISVSSHFADGFSNLNILHHKKYATLNDLIDAMKLINLQTISSSITGLFSNIVWIYPMWISNKNIVSQNEQYLGVNNNNLCVCSFSGNVTYSNETSCENIFPMISKSVELDNCQLLNNHWTLLSIQEIYALVSLNRTSLPTPIIININLDFFTVQHSHSLSIDTKLIQRIESKINSLFCIKQLSDEIVIDSWFRLLIENIKITDIDQLFKATDIPTSIFCQSRNFNAKKKTLELLSELRVLNSIHLKELVEVGICIRENLDKKQLELFQRFEICSGYRFFNNLSHCIQDTHSCMTAEFILQMEKLVQILRKVVVPPTIISIVRSSRIGLVSPKLQHDLEKSLLSHLKTIYNLKLSDIIYHDNLLGGPSGWFMRPKFSKSNYSENYEFNNDRNKGNIE